VEVFFVERFLFQLTDTRSKDLSAILKSVLDWVQDRGLVLNGIGWLGGLLRRYRDFRDHFAGGVDVREVVRLRSCLGLPVKLLELGCGGLFDHRLRLRNVELGYCFFRCRRDGVNGAGGHVLGRLDSNLLRLFFRSLDYRCALAKLAGRDRIDAIGGGGFNGLVLDGFLGDRLNGWCDECLGYFIGYREDADAIGLVDHFGAGLLWLRIVAELLPWFGTTMTREGFAGKHRAAVPAFGDGIARYLGNDDIRIYRFGWCGCGCRGCGLFSALAVLRKRLAGKHDGLRCGAIECCGFSVGWGFFYAIERSFGSEATRNPGGTLIAVATTAAAISTVAVVTSTVSAITTAVILRNGCGVGIGDGSGRIRNWLFGCSVDLVGIALAVNRCVVRSKLRLRLGASGLRRFIARATATAAATTTTPATAAISTGSAFA
jgi:hypothetical protein